MQGDDLQGWTIELDDKKNELDKLFAGTVPESMPHKGLGSEATPQWVVEQYAMRLGEDLANSKNEELHIALGGSESIVNTAKEGLWVRKVESKKRYVFMLAMHSVVTMSMYVEAASRTSTCLYMCYMRGR